ncbi:MAG TPA: hypothetical protein DEO59_14605 [Balneola sp.]|nr:hypothetical protein [Balneola sp.]|tara:strand:+ start:1638 stop:3092 length:1455 start_codon:yes stop_codon:yes gene_type:complete
MKLLMTIPKKKELLKHQTPLHILAARQLFSALLVCSLVFLPSYFSNAEEVVTGQETTTNLLSPMEQFTTSGATRSQQSGNGCTSTAFCTGGKQGPGGTFTSTFNLEDQMTIEDINRGFTLDYDVDVKSHSSNTVLESCAGGNVMQNSDCLDIFKLTVSLFDTGSVLAHKFEHEVELDFSGIQNYAYQQIIPQNTYSAMTGEFELYGIDAGYPTGFYGPQFSDPSLTTTFDIVTFIEAEIIDILNDTDILDTNIPADTEVTEMEIVVENSAGEQVTTLELEVNTEMNMEIELEIPTTDMSTPEVEVEVAEVSTEIETEMQNEPTTDPEPTESGTDTANESEPEPEQTTEAESGEQESEPEPTETETTEAQPEAEEPEGESSDVKPKAKVTKKTSAKQKAARKIVKRMGDKGKYDSNNQLKTLIVMQVLGNSKSFFSSQKMLQDTPNFFQPTTIPDNSISDNNAAAYFMIGGSDAAHNALIELQYK